MVVTLTGCDGNLTYRGKYPELYSIVLHSLLGVKDSSQSDGITIIEEDSYGRILYRTTLSKSHAYENEEYFLEVKGVTLEDKGYARFPDAPTERGAKHLLELVEAKKQGYGAGAMFLIQLKDVNKFSPNDERDQEFGKALRFAKENGVDIFAYNCIVTEDRIEINEPVEIIL